MELNKTIQFYFRQPALESVTTAEIKKAIVKYPYSAPLQFLLLKKQLIENDPGFEEQLSRTTLYFPNTLLLKDQLQEPAPFRPEPRHVPTPDPVIVPEPEPEPVIEPEPIVVPQPDPRELPQPIIVPEPEPEPVIEPLPSEELSIHESPEEPAQEEETTPDPALRADLLRMESPIPSPDGKISARRPMKCLFLNPTIPSIILLHRESSLASMYR